MSEMVIGSLAPWFGGKRTLASRIVRELGKHTMFVEPFCGGVSIVLAKPRSSHEIINDLHGDIINLARVVQDDTMGPALFERASRTMAAEPLLHEAVDTLRASLPPSGEADLERAYRYFVMCWLGRNGEAGLVKSERSRNIAMRFSANGGSAGVRFAAAVDSIPAWWERLRSVMILQRDAFELIEGIVTKDDKGVVLYCDPPYIIKSDEYEHDFASHGADTGLMPDDHDRLAELLHRPRNARVVLSYYDHPRVRELYRGWTFVNCETAKNTSNAGGGAPSRAPEILVINGPSYTEKGHG